MDTTNRVGINEKKAYKKLLSNIPKDKYDVICFVGRGGLSIVQKLAYDLNITKLIMLEHNHTISGYWTQHILFVDDIECTSKTISMLQPSVDTAVLVQRSSSKRKATYKGLKYKGDEYIDFSWEKSNG